MGISRHFGTKLYAWRLNLVKKNLCKLCQFFLSDFWAPNVSILPAQNTPDRFNTSRLNTTTGFYICQGARRFSTKRSIVDNCVLNMLLALKCQNSTVLRFLCKLYSRDSRYSEYASGSQYTKMLNISGILIW